MNWQITNAEGAKNKQVFCARNLNLANVLTGCEIRMGGVVSKQDFMVCQKI